VTGGSDKEGDKKIIELASNIANSIPDLFDVIAATEKYPTKYEQSMNTVLRQVFNFCNLIFASIRSQKTFVYFWLLLNYCY